MNPWTILGWMLVGLISLWAFWRGAPIAFGVTVGIWESFVCYRRHKRSLKIKLEPGQVWLKEADEAGRPDIPYTITHVMGDNGKEGVQVSYPVDALTSCSATLEKNQWDAFVRREWMYLMETKK